MDMKIGKKFSLKMGPTEIAIIVSIVIGGGGATLFGTKEYRRYKERHRIEDNVRYHPSDDYRKQTFKVDSLYHDSTDIDGTIVIPPHDKKRRR